MRSHLYLSSADEIAKLMMEGSIYPIEITRGVLERIDRLNPLINAYITVLRDGAVQEASKAEHRLREGQRIDRLDGIPVAVKDNIYVKGVGCTAGSRILSNFTPTASATVVRKLSDAGTVLVGKANLHEFASGVTNINPFYGATRNPWDTGRIPGGSSGGSAAAVSAGIAYAALGTDTSGSVRIPAALCGVVGLKPTYGLVSRSGSVPLSDSLDHIGIITRTCLDAALVLQKTAGYDPEDKVTVGAISGDYLSEINKPLKGVRFGVPKDYFLDLLDPDVEKAFIRFSERLSEMGAIPEMVHIPMIEQSPVAWAPLRLAEASAFHAEWLRTRPSEYGKDVLEMLQRGSRFTAVEYIQSRELARKIRDSMIKTLSEVDVLITPATPIAAPKIDETTISLNGSEHPVYSLLTRLTIPFNITGLPAVVMPVETSHGLPICVQISSGLFREEIILRVGHLYETEFGPFPNPPLAAS